MRGVALVLVALGVADLVWINTQLGPEAFAASADDDEGAVARAEETRRPPGNDPEPEPVIEPESGKSGTTPERPPTRDGRESERGEEPTQAEAEPKATREPEPEPAQVEAEPEATREAEPEAEPMHLPELAVVSFETSRASLDETSIAALRSVMKTLQARPGLTVTLTGHADVRGKDSINYRIGIRRARAVRRYLVGKGIPPSRITVTSEGEAKPRALGNDADAHRRNRRVEVAFSAKDPR